LRHGRRREPNTPFQLFGVIASKHNVAESSKSERSVGKDLKLNQNGDMCEYCVTSSQPFVVRKSSISVVVVSDANVARE